VAEPDERPEPLMCRVYTHGRRHPIVIGNIQGLRIPPVTPAQLGVAVGALVVLAVARAAWARFGLVANAGVLVLVPAVLAWSVRAVRMEGRAPWRAGLGWLQLVTAPREGLCLGRRDRPTRAVRYRGRSWVGGTDTPATARPVRPRDTGTRSGQRERHGL
jgi:hypothetical protein